MGRYAKIYQLETSSLKTLLDRSKYSDLTTQSLICHEDDDILKRFYIHGYTQIQIYTCKFHIKELFDFGWNTYKIIKGLIYDNYYI